MTFREQSGSDEGLEAARTGIFHRRSTGDYVVLWKGREICRYATIEDFIIEHERGLRAMEENQAELLGSIYRNL